MIVIAESYLRFANTLDETLLRESAARLLSMAEDTVRGHTGYLRLLERLDDGAEIQVSVRLEQGSTKAWITLTTLVTVITLYGSIRESLDYIVHDAKEIGRVLVRRAPESLGMAGARPEARQVRAGHAGRLRKLFDQVERRDLSPDEATRRAMKILQHAGPELPSGLGEQLSTELQEAESRDGQRRHRIPRRKLVTEFALLPPSESRRRRIGVIARRDPKDGRLRVDTY